MRVQCDVCEKAVAQLVCCADEAALCLACDEKVHAANKLASKHHRLRLLPDHPLPICDICQEKTAFIFCLEDRALVCRECDVCIHAANTLAAGHRRFLATGVRVALDNTDAEDTSLCKPSLQPPAAKSSVQPNLHVTPTDNPPTHVCPAKKLSVYRHVEEPHDQVQNSFKQFEEWQNSEGFSEVASSYPFADIERSKSDLARLNDQDWMLDLNLLDEPVCAEPLAKVPETLVISAMDELAHNTKLETSSKGKSRQDLSVVPEFDDVSVVPDLMSFMASIPPLKRQKTVLGS